MDQGFYVSPQVDQAIESIYMANGRSPVLDVSLSHLRTSLGNRGDNPDLNPFAQTIIGYQTGEATTYSTSALCRHYETWHPKTVAEALGLGRSDIGSPLGGSPRGLTTPWSPLAAKIESSQRILLRVNDIRLEGEQYDRTIEPSEGYPHFGPVSDEYGAHEFDRYCQTGQSIKELGFIPEMDGYVRVELMVSGESWAVRVKSGHHRIAAVIALNIDPVTVVIDPSRPVVRREDARSWPGVSSGLFDLDQATAVFDRIMEGRPPYDPS